MSTNTQIIRDALQDLGVIDEVQAASAEQVADGVRRLNQMMARWAVEGTELGYFAQSSPTAACPIPDWAETGVTAALALELAPSYGASISPELAKKYDDGYAVILRTLLNLKLEGADMSHLPGRQHVWNIETGE